MATSVKRLLVGKALRTEQALAQALGAIAGLFGGTFAALCGGLLTAAGWFVANASLRQWLSRNGSVLLYLTIPLLLFGACCMDWLEKGKPRPSLRCSLKVVRPAEDGDSKESFMSSGRRPETMKINHEETKSTKIFSVLSSSSSFLRG